MVKGYKAVKLVKPGDGWTQWDASGRRYGIVELEIAEDHKGAGDVSEAEMESSGHLTGVYVVTPKGKVEDGNPYFGKRRVNKAQVVGIKDFDGKDAEGVTARADQSWEFIFTLGSDVGLSEKENSYQKKKEFLDESKPCGPGIHYFADFEQAVALGKHWQNIHE